MNRPGPSRGRPNRARSVSLLALVVLAGCASVPPQRYGVRTVTFSGVETFDEYALRACLGTEERERFALSAGTSTQLECGVPPFDGSRARAPLWDSWTGDWPLFDAAVFERDLQRIERWYRARGYYDARVTVATVSPSQAREFDRIPAMGGECERVAPGEGCAVDIEIQVDEGDPVRVSRVVIDIERSRRNPAIAALRPQLERAIELRAGELFDEALYDRSKNAIARTLTNASYARARVEGAVTVDRESGIARVTFHVDPGVPCTFGNIVMTGYRDLRVSTVLGAVDIRPGSPYSQTAIAEAQRRVYRLGAFSSVQIKPRIPEEEGDAVIPLDVHVIPGRRTRVGLGLGLAQGQATGTGGGDTEGIPQWDVHALFVAEHRNFLDRMGRVRFEERPRLIFQSTFPGLATPRFGNLALIDWRQPAFLEAQTQATVNARWEIGPDPFLGFFRHDVEAELLGVERLFLDGHLFVKLGLHANFLFVTDDAGADTPSDYQLFFLEQFIRLDLRDNPQHPTEGLYASLSLHEAGPTPASSWNYIRMRPEVRAYAPLPFGAVLAARFSLGAMFVLDADQDLDTVSQTIGPTRYRLRGGGARGNRGFVVGDLGAGQTGGQRSWLASLELRMPVFDGAGVTLFLDVGDVNAGDSWRFEQLHTSMGLGFRYYDTPAGTIRLDVGIRIPGLQAIGQLAELPRQETSLGLFRFPGAIHLTLGEAF